MKSYKVCIVEKVHIPEYHISIQPETKNTFKEQLDSLLCKIKQCLSDLRLESRHLVFVKLFLSDYVNQKEELASHELFHSYLENCITSFIEQPPLDGTKINLLLFFLRSDEIDIEKKGEATLICISGRRHIYQSVNSFGNDIQTPYEQTMDAFRRHIHLLSGYHACLKDNCIRTWIYSRDIDKDYGGIVKARNDRFDLEGLTSDTHYIASTGIEGKGFHPQSSVNIDFYSIENVEDIQIRYLHANDYLNNTSEYGVAFERATALKYDDKTHIFVSGTASIDKHGDCVHRNQVLKQAERLFLNIRKLLEDANAQLTDIRQMIVYLRDVSDYPSVEKFLETNFRDTPSVIVLARVCRPEWLMEVECLAVKAD